MNPNQQITCSQNRKTFILYANGAIFSVVALDKGKGKYNKSKKCDYLITKDTKDIQIFIELKGSDIAHAYRQILSSYENRENIQSKCYAAIVCSKYPQIDSTIQALQRKTGKVFEKIFVKSNKLETQYNSSNNSIEKIN